MVKITKFGKIALFGTLEKVVTSKQLKLAMETEEERRARLENDAATKWLRLVMESGGDGSYHTAQV